MINREIVVGGLGSLRAKSAALFVYQSSQFICNIRIVSGNRSADGKSLLGVLSLMIKSGDIIVLQCGGIDEEKAMEILSSFFENIEE